MLILAQFQRDCIVGKAWWDGLAFPELEAVCSHVAEKKQRTQGQDLFIGLLHQPGPTSQSLLNGDISDITHNTL